MKGNGLGIKKAAEELMQMLDVAADSDIIENATLLEELSSKLRDIDIVITFFLDD